MLSSRTRSLGARSSSASAIVLDTCMFPYEVVSSHVRRTNSIFNFSRIFIIRSLACAKPNRQNFSGPAREKSTAKRLAPRFTPASNALTHAPCRAGALCGPRCPARATAAGRRARSPPGGSAARQSGRPAVTAAAGRRRPADSRTCHRLEAPKKPL